MNENNEILDLVAEYLTDMRLGDIVKENQEYQDALRTEREIYTRLSDSLNEEQREILEAFLTASNETATVYEKLTYQQGMRDLYALLRSLGR